ncbi:uncharacterized protein LOC119832485 [Zerene cesonia]|uniref:uncharacterized protein LOC119832485 n=1 Tax=Zerene cesonia TaxID=33412 RepID=UPI0018E59A8A|nr:uncharacterized protein LOC119832485 [Zerene cesonia]
MEHNPQTNRDEQYPLLKVENVDGGGDNKPRTQAVPTIVTTGWNVTCTPKQSWFDRWPEFMSACWMALILFAISFLVFYALGMSAYRRQPVVVFKCNNSKPASDVYFHCIIPRSQSILPRFSQYLSSIAMHYPNLRFNVYFLIDDSLSATLQSSNRTRFFKQLVPAFPRTLNMILEQSTKREIQDFQRRYQNVNITIMNLSKYMTKTPLRYIWRTIPLTYLPFYARIYSIWQNGGIAFDLPTFNHIYNNHQSINPKIKAILKQHNDGIETDKYISILNSMDVEDESKMFSSIINLINRVLNQTSLFFDTDITPEVKLVDYTPFIRTHRNKRNAEQEKIQNVSSNINKSDINGSNITEISITLLKNITNQMNISSSNNTEETNRLTNPSLPKVKTLTKSTDELPTAPKSEASVEFPEMSIFYYFTVFDDIDPPYPLPFAPIKGEVNQNDLPMKITEFKKLTKQSKLMTNHLSISSDGLFVAAPLRYHPFLAQLLSTGCKRVNPKIAIDDTLMNQCSVFIRDDVYCDNIHIMNSIF